jgi:hypothetical protein
LIPPFLLQLAGSAIAVAMMIGLAAWATYGRGAAPLDEADARRWLAHEFPGLPIETLWLATDGRGALARSGGRALILTRVGDGYAARQVDWSEALGAEVRDGRVRFALGDVTAPTAALALAGWPPQERAA